MNQLVELMMAEKSNFQEKIVALEVHPYTNNQYIAIIYTVFVIAQRQR